jgi:hypothetical protein
MLDLKYDLILLAVKSSITNSISLENSLEMALVN